MRARARMPRDPATEDETTSATGAEPGAPDVAAPRKNGDDDEMSWLQKLMPSRIRTEGGNAKGKVPEGLWGKCAGCGAVLYGPELERNLEVCPKCGHHHPIRARARLAALFDEGSGEELFGSL